MNGPEKWYVSTARFSDFFEVVMPPLPSFRRLTSSFLPRPCLLIYFLRVTRWEETVSCIGYQRPSSTYLVMPCRFCSNVYRSAFVSLARESKDASRHVVTTTLYCIIVGKAGNTYLSSAIQQYGRSVPGTSANVREGLFRRNISLVVRCSLRRCARVSAAESEGAHRRT